MFDIVVPSSEDASRIAEIHLAAMDSNPLLHVQFPNATALAALHEYLRLDTIQYLHCQDKKRVLMAKNRESGEIVGFAKWDIHRYHDSDTNDSGIEEAHQHHEDEPDWPIECCRKYLDMYSRLAEGVRKKVMGRTPSYRKYSSASSSLSSCLFTWLFCSFVCTMYAGRANAHTLSWLWSNSLFTNSPK
jgi:hypothetical protein